VSEDCSPLSILFPNDLFPELSGAEDWFPVLGGTDDLFPVVATEEVDDLSFLAAAFTGLSVLF
jgi:hypothetical protein